MQTAGSRDPRCGRGAYGSLRDWSAAAHRFWIIQPCAHVILAALICALLILPLRSIASTASPALRADMLRVLQENELTGAVWSLVTADGEIAVDAAGVKDARNGKQLSPHDRVHIGSVTKTLLAAGVLRLVSEGRLALDSPIAEYLPDIAIDNPWQASDPIKLRHLLDHTAGLDDARMWQVFSLKAHPDTPLLEAFSRDPSLLRVRSRPGSRFSYSNMGYALLGLVIESVTHERYEMYLDQNLLAPLDMRDSTFTFVSQEGPDADRRLAMGHFERGTVQPSVPVYLRPSMQFTTTAHDMALFSRFLMSDGRIDGEVFIETQLLRAMGQPFATEAAVAGLSTGYGLGLARRDRHGLIGQCHSGNTIGYRAMLCIFPQQQNAFFVAVNADSESATYEKFNALLIDALEISAIPPASIEQPMDDVSAWEGIYIPSPNRFQAFEWLDTVFSFVHVSWDGSQLRLRSLQSRTRFLLPAGGALFRATDRVDASHVLLKSADAKRVLSDGFQSYERTSFAKIGSLWLSLCAGVLGLIFIFVAGFVRLLRRRLTLETSVPFVAVIALLLPLSLFFQQSFLQLGDVTPASATLAVTTAVLPFAMTAGLILQLRHRASGSVAVLDIAAMIAVLQWAIVLAAWGLLPVRLWL